MKKSVTYKPSVQIRTICQVISAICTCPAGGTPAFCKHVFALLHAINDCITKKLYEVPTERLQTWYQPKPIKIVPQTAEEVFMREPALEVENEKMNRQLQSSGDFVFDSALYHQLGKAYGVGLRNFNELDTCLKEKARVDSICQQMMPDK
ncbi:SWIM-type domain-containing protein [Trichonephila inaurata madagascariensis]|uniref:SWIM-type domain-containing protein n=1 Tax=Trichonephila inaurata madagascariensis TaxID=2747483 RepID=A0A8X6XPC9_9ARAC|nr:SWIM-type domain-containing protein [Trichonephila inaurata madagascariensis]